MLLRTIGILLSTALLHRSHIIFACFATSSTSSTSSGSTAESCSQCTDIVPIDATYPQTMTGVASFTYSTDPTSGCRTATMTCSPSANENPNDLALIVADTSIFALDVASSSVTLTCNANANWQIDSTPPYVFTTIQCAVGS